MAIAPIGGAGVPAPKPQSGSSEIKPLASPQQARQAHNRQILEAQESISLQAGNQPLLLTLRAAIEAINEKLAPDLGANAIERAQQSGLDVSPEATAERIVSLSTALFSRYQDGHPELGTAEQAQQFVDIIRGGIEQGFAEAREILDGLGVLEGDIASNIDKTFELVQEGLKRFLERFMPPEEAGAGDPGSEPSDG